MPPRTDTRRGECPQTDPHCLFSSHLAAVIRCHRRLTECHPDFRSGMLHHERPDSRFAQEPDRRDGDGAGAGRAGRPGGLLDPDRHPAGLQEPGGADAGLLQRDAGGQHREEHHGAAGARGGPGIGRPAAGVAVDRRHQHRPRLLPQQRRPQRRPDRGEFAGGLGISHDAAGHAAAGRPAL